MGGRQGARHVAKDIVGKGIANPMALLLSTSMLLRHLQLHSFSDRQDSPHKAHKACSLTKVRVNLGRHGQLLCDACRSYDWFISYNSR